MSTNLKMLLVSYFNTILHYVEDHPHSVNLMCSMSFTVYNLLPIYDQGLMTAKLKLFDQHNANNKSQANCTLAVSPKRSSPWWNVPSLNILVAYEGPGFFSMSPHNISWLNTANKRMNFAIKDITALMHTIVCSLLCSTNHDAQLHILFLILVFVIQQTIK